MATLGDIGLAAGINIITALLFLLAFAFLRLQPFNDRVYFPKWYLKRLRTSPSRSGTFVSKFVNLDLKSYVRFLNWIPDALKMPELELVEHAGLDSAVYLRIYLLGYAIPFFFFFSLKLFAYYHIICVVGSSYVTICHLLLLELSTVIDEGHSWQIRDNFNF